MSIFELLPPPKPEGLTDIQERHLQVIDNMQAGYTRARAYQMVYPKATKATANVEACRILRQPHAKAYHQALIDWSRANAAVTNARTIAELKAIAYARPDALMEWGEYGVVVRDSRQLEPEEMAAIKRITHTETVTEEGETRSQMKIETHDKLGALRTLAQIGGLTTDLSQALQTLQTYGINIKEDADGKFFIDDEQEPSERNGAIDVQATPHYGPDDDKIIGLKPMKD